jgi:hypothetical protein
MTADLVSISGKKEVSLLPNFVSKPPLAHPNFHPLVTAVTLCVIPPLCIQVQALKYHVKLYPREWVARFLIKGKLTFSKRSLLLQLARSLIFLKVLHSVTECFVLH